MRRSEKAKALKALKPEADGYTGTRFAKPSLIQAARAERGHDRMTPAEVARYRMGRGAMSSEKAGDTRRRKAEGRRAQRVLGGRRITGHTAGTKEPQAWHRENVQRKITGK